MDFCAKRLSFFEKASLIIDMGFRKELTLIVSSLTFINVAYILRKVYPQDLVMQKLSLRDKISDDRLLSHTHPTILCIREIGE